MVKRRKVTADSPSFSLILCRLPSSQKGKGGRGGSVQSIFAAMAAWGLKATSCLWDRRSGALLGGGGRKLSLSALSAWCPAYTVWASVGLSVGKVIVWMPQILAATQG